MLSDFEIRRKEKAIEQERMIQIIMKNIVNIIYLTHVK